MPDFRKAICNILCLTLIVLPAYAQDTQAEIPILEETVRLDGQSPAIIPFEANANDVISIQTLGISDAANNIPDTIIEVLSPDHLQLAYNDDTYELAPDGTLSIDRNAKITNLLLPQSGEFTIRINTFNGVTVGDVQVILVQGNLFNEEIEESDELINITADLPKHKSYTYRFQPEANGIATITARDTSLTIDPILVITGDDGEVLAWNDDHINSDTTLDSFDAQIPSFAFNQGESYQITVSDFLGRSGSFELTIHFENN